MAKRGPKTAAGKAVVSLNAVSHGALSNAVIVPGVESLAEWESVRDGLLRDLAPKARWSASSQTRSPASRGASAGSPATRRR